MLHAPGAVPSSLGFALAVIASLLLPADRHVTRDVELVGNDLCIVAPATPYDPSSGLASDAPRPIPAEARCPVCGMYPARYPRWAAQTIFKDGATHYFDSPANLFDFLRRVDHYDRRYTLNDVVVSYVRDHASGQWVDARNAFFVHGSTAAGPMRNADLPAFASRSAAENFARRYGGETLTPAQVTPEVLQALRSRSIDHRHGHTAGP